MSESWRRIIPGGTIAKKGLIEFCLVVAPVNFDGDNNELIKKTSINTHLFAARSPFQDERMKV